MPIPGPLDPDILISVISGQQTSRAILFTGLTILIYDHVLLLPLEIEKIWKAEGSSVKWIYIANRIINWTVLILGIISKIVTFLFDLIFLELSSAYNIRRTFRELTLSRSFLR
jgi:hypothetical protein